MGKDIYWGCAQTLAWICTREEPSDWLRENDTHIALTQELDPGRCPVIEALLGDLLAALRRGDLTCRADQSGESINVPQGMWQHMKICPGLDGFYARNKRYTSSNPNATHLASLVFRKSVVTRLWRSTKLKTRRKGRVAQYEWPTFKSEVIRILEHEGDVGFPSDPVWNQSALEKKMRNWCEKNWTKLPVESVIRDHVKSALQAFRDRPSEDAQADK